MSIIGNVKDKIAQHIDVYVRLIKINFIERTSRLLSYFIFSIIALFFVFCIMLFLGLGLVEGFILVDIPKVASFFIVIGIYALLFLLIYVRRKAILRSFSSAFIRVLTEGDEEDNERKNNSPTE